MDGWSDSSPCPTLVRYALREVYVRVQRYHHALACQRRTVRNRTMVLRVNE